MPDPVDLFELELPRDADPAAVAAIRQELTATAGVKRSGGGASRSLDPQALTVWVSLAASVVTTAGATITVMQQVLGLFKKHRIKGVKLRLANGTVVEADEMTPEALQKLLDS